MSGRSPPSYHSAHWLPTPKKLLYTVTIPARGLLNREKNKTKMSGSAPPPPCAPRSEKIKIKITRRIYMSRRYSIKSALRRSRFVSRPYKDSYESSARPMGVASQNSTLPCAIATFPVSLPLSSPGDVWPRLPLLPSTRP